MIEGFRQLDQTGAAEGQKGVRRPRKQRHGYSFCLVGLMLLSASVCCVSQVVSPLTQVSQVVALTNLEAAKSLPVEIEATVTFFRPGESSLFVTDRGSSIYVEFSDKMGLLPGDRVVVSGVTQASFRSNVMASHVRFLSHGHLPAPQPAKFEDLIAARWDCDYVQVNGHVLSAAFDQSDPDTPGAEPGIYLQVQIPHGIVHGYMAHPGKLSPEDLMESDVTLAGVVAGAFDSKMQMAGVWININSDKDLQILRKPVNDPWSLPEVSLDRVVQFYRHENESERVHISGLLTYYEAGSLAVVENEGKTMLVETQTTLPLHPGQAVEATGFPAIAQGSIRLVNARLRASAEAASVQPPTINWEAASVGTYAYNLVAMEGEVVAMVHDSRVDLFVIESGKHLFSASVRRNSSESGGQAAGQGAGPTIGSLVRVVGVCFVDDGNHWRDRLWFDLRMRSLSDVVVLQKPTFWNAQRLGYISFILTGAILMAIIWAGLLERRVRSQTAALARQSQEDAIRERNLARQEQQRSRILELITSPASLEEVLDEICAMVSTRLYEAPCWYVLNDRSSRDAGGGTDARRGTVVRELCSPDGTKLGYLHAIPWVAAPKEAEVATILSVGARLAELAIDTRRLYSDLRRRSEYDLLTELPNRFTLERTVDQMISSAVGNEGVFGLIYVDLDRFKQVNDEFGHRTGDLYLQAVARRMRAQMRGDDVLARVGGDEFIALVPVMNSRKDVEEIAVRLERCFDEPFEIDGHTFQGSASVGIAQFPVDGLNQEELQRAADRAMYIHKQEKVAGRG